MAVQSYMLPAVARFFMCLVSYDESPISGRLPGSLFLFPGSLYVPTATGPLALLDATIDCAMNGVIDRPRCSFGLRNTCTSDSLSNVRKILRRFKTTKSDCTRIIAYSAKVFELGFALYTRRIAHRPDTT